MKIELTPQQKQDQASFRTFVNEEIIPYANRFDEEERVPSVLIEKIAQKGYLGSLIPKDQGGSGLDFITYGLLTEEIGRGCSSVRSLLTVHDMVARSILKFGRTVQKEYWLPNENSIADQRRAKIDNEIEQFVESLGQICMLWELFVVALVNRVQPCRTKIRQPI